MWRLPTEAFPLPGSPDSPGASCGTSAGPSAGSQPLAWPASGGIAALVVALTRAACPGSAVQADLDFPAATNCPVGSLNDTLVKEVKR